MTAPTSGSWWSRFATTRRGQALAVTVAAAVGFGGAASIDAAFAAPAVPVADGFGPAGDGLTRLLVTAPQGLGPAELATLRAVDGVESAQALFDGSALVAGAGITPETLRAAVPGAEVTVSEPGEVLGGEVSDPYWSAYGWNLLNTGGNAYGQSPVVAGADVAAPTGWRSGSGAGTVVAVVDSGVLATHPDLRGALWTNPAEACGSTDTDGDGLAGDCHGWNFYKNSADVTNAGEDNSHGTSVSGAVAARAGNGEGSAGVAPGVTIMPLVIGSGSTVDMHLGAQAIRYAADHGADVVNASWGGNNSAAILQQAIDYANSKGVVVVVAAGNDAGNRDTAKLYPASLSAPNLVKVGNSTAADTANSTSAYGPTSVDLFAPGTLVFTTWNDGSYRLVSGTSIAAPQVAAAYALYRAHDPAADAATLKQELLRDVQPVAAFAGRSVTGGRLSLNALGARASTVTYTFSGMVAEPGTVAPTVVANGTGAAGAYAVELGLGMEQDGQVLAVTRHELTVDGVTAATDDAGTARFGLSSRSGPGSVTLTPSTSLDEGRYVLTAQLFVDGAPLGQAFAAPLLVGQPASSTPGTPVPGTPVPGTSPGASAPSVPGASAPGTPTPGTSKPGTSTPSLPGASSPGVPTPGTSVPGTSVPGTSVPVTSVPGTSVRGTPPPSNPGASTPSVPGIPSPGTPSPGIPSPGIPSPGTSSPGTTPPGTTTPGTTTPGTTTPGATTPSTGGGDGGTTPDVGGSKDYPTVGPFRLTSISPTRVSTAGGDVVTIQGEAIPNGARVRIGETTGVAVTRSSTTSLTFTAPPLVADTYDVHVFAPDGTSSVLPAGLTYVPADGGSGTAPPADAGSGTGPSTGPSTGGGADPPTGGGTDPSTGSGADPSTGGSPAPGTTGVSGRHGERLMPSARFAALGSLIWSVDCTRSCSGVVI